MREDKQEKHLFDLAIQLL